MSRTDANAPEDAIRAQALKLGFSVARFTDLPEVWDATEHLKRFVEAGYHGQMGWMADTLHRRSHPSNLWPEAKSALVLGLNYGPDHDPRRDLEDSGLGNLSVYARNDDYHDLIKGRLKQLGGWIASRTGSDLKVFVDTAPVMEKPLAQRAGLGWQGKHTNLVSRDYGSWMFLGVILFAHAFAPDEPEVDHCGSCRACLDVCPTQAFVAPYRMDARRCLSYLTIEHKGPWPTGFRAAMGNRIYGCDDCLAACPWNKFAVESNEIRLRARDGFGALRLTDLATLEDAEFRALFTRSAVKRIGVRSFRRNVNYALGNALRGRRDQTIENVLVSGARHQDPVIRGSAVWALRQGLPDEDLSPLRAVEHDHHVLAEYAGEIVT